MPPSLEQLGVLRAADGKSLPVRMSQEASTGRWRFSRSTVSQIDPWYVALPDRFLREHLPSVLLRPGPADLLWWQWLGLALVVAVSLLGGSVTSRLLRRALGRLNQRTATSLDDRLLSRLRGPLTLACALGIGRLLMPWLELFGSGQAVVSKVLHGAFLADLLWGFWRLVDATAEAAGDAEWSRQHAASRALIPLGRRVGKALVVVAAGLLFLAALGYSITSLIAGLGIGGLALALASQKTVENLFGAFSLALDQRLRLACTLGLEYGTDAARLRAVLAALEQMLRTHPKIWPDSINVNFEQLAASSLDVEIMVWLATSDWNEFLRIRQDVLLGFMEVVQRCGASFAFPTQTIHLAAPAGASAEVPPAERAARR